MNFGAIVTGTITVTGAVGPVPVTTVVRPPSASTLLVNVPAVEPTVTEKVSEMLPPAPMSNGPVHTRS